MGRHSYRSAAVVGVAVGVTTVAMVGVGWLTGGLLGGLVVAFTAGMWAVLGVTAVQRRAVAVGGRSCGRCASGWWPFGHLPGRLTPSFVT